MWLPDHGTAESASWRIARRLHLRHEGIEVGWRPGPEGVDYDPMTIRGRGASGDFEILMNRMGTIRVIVTVPADDEDEDDEVSETLHLEWDEALRREPGSWWDQRPFEETLARLERAAGLRPTTDDRPGASYPSLDPDAYAMSVITVLSSVHTALERPVTTSTVTAFSVADEQRHGTHALFVRFSGMLDDVRSRFHGPDDERQLWIVHVQAPDVDDLVIDPTGPRAWVTGLDRPLDLLALGGRPDRRSADPALAALRLLGPTADLAPFTVAPFTVAPAPVDTPAPGTELEHGVIEAPLRPWGRLPALAASIDRFAGRVSEDEEGSGRWLVRVVPLVGPERVFRSHRSPQPGPEPGTVRFFLDDEPMLHRPLRSDDAGWIARYDIGLGRDDLHQLFDVIAELRADLDASDPDAWSELAEQRDAAEELVALVAEGGRSVHSLHYLLLDGTRVVTPLFRDGGAWDDGLPPQDPRWHAEALRVARAHGEVVDEDEFDASDDPFALLSASEYLPVHPTLARAILGHFDRGALIPVDVARLAAGDADELLEPEELLRLGLGLGLADAAERGRRERRSDVIERLLSALPTSGPPTAGRGGGRA